MAVFVCRVSDHDGKVFEIKRTADSADHLLRDLASEGLYAISVSSLTDAKPTSGRISRSALLEFTEVLSLLLASKLSLKDAMRIAEESLDRRPAIQLAAQTGESLEKGQRFSSVLDGYRKSVPPLYRGLVRIGERVGSLDRVMSQLVYYLKNQKDLTDRISTALMYPSLILVLALAGMILLSAVVIPMLSDTFSGLGGAASAMLELATERVARMTSAAWIVAASIGAVVAGMLTARLTSRVFKEGVDRVLLATPVIGPAIGRIVASRFVFAMETLTQSAIPVEDALSESADVLGNEAFASACRRARERVRSGATLGDALKEEKVIPARIRSWVSIGEHTGSLSEVFGRMRVFYQAEVERAMARLAGLVEPTLIVAVGAVMMFVIIRIIIPVLTAVRTIE